MVFFGAGLGRYPHVQWRGKIFPALNCVLVGPSGCGKGESLGIIRELYTFPEDKRDLLASAHYLTITSGKRLVSIMCNAMETFEEDGENRFLGIDEECASTFRCAKIWTGTLSGILIKLIDGQKIEEKVGGQVINLPAFHYSSVGHITPRALKKSMGNEQFTNGLGNRFLYLDIPRQEFSLTDSRYDEQQMDEIRNALLDSLDKGGQKEQLEFGEGAFQTFTDYVRDIRSAIEEDNPHSFHAGKIAQNVFKTCPYSGIGQSGRKRIQTIHVRSHNYY